MKKNLLLLFIVFAGFSCKKDVAAPVAAGDFKSGTAWVYKYTNYDATGTVLTTGSITLTITGQQTVGGETFWVATGAGSPSLIRKGTSGYYTIQNSISQLQFKTPAAVNDTWRVTYSSSAGDYSDYTILGINQNVTVPKGTIPCFYAEGHDSNSLEDKVWYNDANMLVKQEEYDDNGSGVMFKDFSLELVNFTL